MINMFEMNYRDLLDRMYEQSRSGIVYLPVEINITGEEHIGEYTFSWTKEDVARVKKAMDSHIRETMEIVEAGADSNLSSEEAQKALDYNPLRYIFRKTYI